jgi:hypothetical protein
MSYLAVLTFKAVKLSVGITTTKCQINYLTDKTKNCTRSVDAHFQNREGSLSLSILPMKTSYQSFMYGCNQSPCRLTMMAGQTLLTLHCRSLSECGREGVSFSFAFKCSLYHIYERLNPIATQITQDTRREIIHPGLARQEVAGRIAGQFWNRTELFVQSNPTRLAGYPDQLVSLIRPAKVIPPSLFQG